MKFSNDKKSTLLIYTNDNMKGSDDKMENAIKKELEATKSALKLQTIRCRQLVAAFTKKLHEKELELRASKDLRDQQLSRLLRALLILESRLKKEQKHIRQQLEEKDLIIENQKKEISKLKTLETTRKWSDATENNEDFKKWSVLHGEQYVATGEERLDNLCKGLLNTSPLYKQESGKELETKTENNNNNNNNIINNNKNNNNINNKDNDNDNDKNIKEKNAFKDNPVLESVNQILLRDEEELLKSVKPVSINLTEKGLFANEGDSNEWYETNSNAVIEEQTDSGTWCINIEENKEQETKTKRDLPTEKTSPIKSQRLEEKVCLEMSKKNLTVVDLEEIDSNNTERAVSPAKSTASYEEIIPVSTTNKVVRNLQKPPALPPKPARLLKPYQILQQKNLRQPAQQSSATNVQTSSDHQPSKPPQTSNKPPQPAGKPAPSFTEIPPNNRQRLPELKTETKEPDKVRGKPLDSNVKPKKNQVNSHPIGSLDPMDRILNPQFGKPKKKEEIVTNCGAIKIGSSVSSLITGLSRDKIVTELSAESVIPADDSHVSQLVRQFEVLGKLGVIDSERNEDEMNDLRKNFEEFKLEDSYVDSVIEGEENGRLDGDGAENRNMVNYYATLTIVPPPLPKEGPPGPELEYKMYETFLENTGLSQKSILTPSRMLSNHRSCLKPKDVKHRSKIKAAAAIEKCNVNTTNGGSTVKYWTEPFL